MKDVIYVLLPSEVALVCLLLLSVSISVYILSCNRLLIRLNCLLSYLLLYNNYKKESRTQCQDNTPTKPRSPPNKNQSTAPPTSPHLLFQQTQTPMRIGRRLVIWPRGGGFRTGLRRGIIVCPTTFPQSISLYLSQVLTNTQAKS